MTEIATFAAAYFYALGSLVVFFLTAFNDDDEPWWWRPVAVVFWPIVFPIALIFGRD